MAPRKIDRVEDVTRIALQLHDAHDSCGVTAILEQLCEAIHTIDGITRDELMALFAGLARAAGPRLLDLMHREAVKQERFHIKCAAETALDEVRGVVH